MSASVRISRKSARALEEFVAAEVRARNVGFLLTIALGELRGELARPAKKAFVSAPTRKQTKAKKKRTKKELRTEVRAAIMARADGKCEACGRSSSFALRWDHFFGRVRVAETERSGWALCRICDGWKTLNQPSAIHWLERFILHAEKHGFTEEAGMATRLLAKHETKAEFAKGAAAHG